MTLPTVITNNNTTDDDSDIFGPPRSSPIRSNRPKIPMISAKLRLREERKRILQLCAHKLERIKDSETNLRRSVCINNTYSRLTDELRREKQNKLLANLPKSESINNSQLNNFNKHNDNINNNNNNNNILNDNNNNKNISENNNNINNCLSHNNYSKPPSSPRPPRRYSTDTDLETLDRELNAIDAVMPLPPVDPEITQGAEQLEKIVSRKRTRIEEEDNDRLVREALSQFYLPSPRLLSGIDDCPLLPPDKRQKTDIDLDLNLDLNQNQKEFEVIMDALRLGGNGNVGGVPCTNVDSCGQAAMLSESGVFHNLVVASLET